MKVFVIAYNRLTMLRNLCDFVAATGHEPIIIDNASTYHPLIDWYDVCPYKVYRMDKNYGHLVLWKSGLIDTLTDQYFALTDHDLDLTGIPYDYIDVLVKALIHNPQVTKAGLSLRIDDLPDNPYTREVITWESKFWNTKKDGLGNFMSDVDTTFAVYDKSRDFGLLPPEGHKFHWAVRTPPPYVCRHIPWYQTKESIAADEEETFYHNSVTTYWSQKLKELL